jgi:hypothetical protein
LCLAPSAAFAQGRADDDGAACSALPSQSQLRTALIAAKNASNGGFNLDMWGTIVNRDGIVCAVAFTGTGPWRPVARQPRYFGTEGKHRELVQPPRPCPFDREPLGGGPAWRLALRASGKQPRGLSVWPTAVNSSNLGQHNDPMVGGKIGGVNVFGGGLALYDNKHNLIGGIGVSGDTSCADHNIAWRTRNNLGLDYVPGGVSGVVGKPDNINYQGQVAVPSLAADFSHPICKIAGVDTVSAISAALPATQP